MPVKGTAQINRSLWISWLQVVLALLILYALIMVFGGSLAEEMFTAFGFGPPESISSAELSAYLKLPFVVIGSVLAGWSTLMLVIVRGPLRSLEPWAIPALGWSVGIWFVLDTGMSLVLGFALHAVFNVPFALALALPLWRLHSLRKQRVDGVQ